MWIPTITATPWLVRIPSTSEATLSASKNIQGTGTRWFRVPRVLHLTNIVFTLVAMATLRWHESRAAALLSILPGGVYAEKKAAGFYEPLSATNWVLHFMPLIINMEIMYAFYIKSHDERNYKKVSRDMFQTMLLFFAVSQAQGIVTLCSHSQIGVSDELEVTLMSWDYLLMRIHVFGIGLGILVGWWTMIPVAFLTSQDYLLFENAAGGCLSSTLSLGIVLSRCELPLVFKVFYTVLALTPFLVPDSSTDIGHIEGIISQIVPLWTIALSINRSVELTADDASKSQD